MILIVDMNTKKTSIGFYEFVLPIVAATKDLDDSTIKHYSEVKLEDIAHCDSVILSGTPLKDNATLSQLDTFKWLKTNCKPVLGICAGFQTIGLVFNTKLKRCFSVGMTEIATLKENSLFSGNFKAYTLHNYSLEPSDAFEVLAESTQCVQAIKHKQRNIFGVLFHPEVRNIEILQRFVNTFAIHRRV